MLDSATQRFRSADPAEDDLNLYRYVNNDPVNRGDPSGLFDAEKLKESLATYDPLTLAWLEEQGFDIVAYTPTMWESLTGWDKRVKAGEGNEPGREQVRLPAGLSNWGAFLHVTQGVRRQEGFKEWKQEWLKSRGLREERDNFMTPAPGSPEYEPFMKKIAEQDHQRLLQMMRKVGATESEINHAEWQPFFHELL